MTPVELGHWSDKRNNHFRAEHWSNDFSGAGRPSQEAVMTSLLGLGGRAMKSSLES